VKLLFALAILIALVVLWSLYAFYARVQIAKALVKVAVPYQLNSTDTRVTLLVLGDSTGVGVGAVRPEDTVAGRLASKMGATSVENYSVSGAVVADLAGQLAQANLKTYSTILLQIGANDIMWFHSVAQSGRTLAHVLATLPHADTVYIMSAGNIGAATLIPFFVRPFHAMLNQKYHEEFAKVATAAGAHYVNLYAPPAQDPFTLEPEKYFSRDGLHPSSEGYRVWFDALERARVTE
jgi:lysophospholipase L1-like esterase